MSPRVSAVFWIPAFAAFLVSVILAVTIPVLVAMAPALLALSCSAVSPKPDPIAGVFLQAKLQYAMKSIKLLLGKITPSSRLESRVNTSQKRGHRYRL